MNTRTEEEQIEVIKRFVHQYGTRLLVLVLAVIGLYAAYQVWQNGRVAAQETASIYYNELALLAGEDALTEQQQNKFDETFARLATEYPESVYAAYAALQKAKMDVQANNLEAAAQSLQWVLDHTANENVKALAALRLARVALSSDELDKALSLLSGKPGAFTAQYEQVKGDVYLAKGDKEQALIAYKKAHELLAGVSATTASRLLEMKISALDSGDQGKVFPR